MWHKHTFKQTVLFSLLFSIIFGLFSPALTELASAAVISPPASTSVMSSYTPTQSVLSYLYYNAMSECINSSSIFKNQGAYGKITNQEVNSGAWFQSAPNIPVGYALKGMGAGFNYVDDWSAKDQDIKCMDTDWIQAAASLWGFDSVGAMYCGLGLESTSSLTNTQEACDPSSTSQNYPYVMIDPNAVGVDRTQLMNNFQAEVQSQIGGDPTLNMSGSQTPMTNPMKYVLYKGAFIGGCLETTPDGVTKLKDPADVNSDSTYFPDKDLKMVDTTGNLDEAKYTDYSTGMNNRTRYSSILAYVQSNRTARTVTCEALANGMNEFAGDYQAYILANGFDTPVQDITPSPNNNNSDTTTCAIGGVGWIVCPVVNFMASVADSAYGYLVNNFLSVKIEAFDTSSPTYSAWSIMRGFANVVFVIAFLIIIFSQLTGFGIDNYGVKKLLPRIIIAAILVNLSYFICQLSVDLSNILGKSFYDLFMGIAVPSGQQSTGFWSGGSWADIAGTILAGAVAGAAIWASLSALIPMLILAVFALVMILFILMARQAIIILLVVVSPLAFVAYLLPNTSQWFTKWRKTLTSMLLLYPIVALIYGVSAFASKILAGVMDTGPLATRLLGEIAAASVVVLPLFLIPSLLKKSLDGVGNIGATLNNLGSKAGKASGKSAVSDKNILGQSLARKDAMANIRRQQKQGGTYQSRSTRGKYNPLGWRTRANKAINASGLSGAVGDQRAAAGYATTTALEDEENTRGEARLKGLGLSQDEVRNLAMSGEVIRDGKVIVSGKKDYGMRDAATKHMVASNDVRGMKQLWDKSTTAGGGIDDRQRRIFADSLQASSSRPTYYGQGAIAQMRTAAHDSTDDTIESAINAGAYSAEKVAGADKDELAEVSRVAKMRGQIGGTGKITVASHQRLIDNAYKAMTDPILSAKVAKNLGKVDDIRQGKYTPEPPT
jgi:hypothetical protein